MSSDSSYPTIIDAREEAQKWADKMIAMDERGEDIIYNSDGHITEEYVNFMLYATLAEFRKNHSSPTTKTEVDEK